ncbi:MAG: hypothetical protein AAFO93_05660, partial [Pseudomonadota bacterium]
RRDHDGITTGSRRAPDRATGRADLGHGAKGPQWQTRHDGTPATRRMFRTSIQSGIGYEHPQTGWRAGISGTA